MEADIRMAALFAELSEELSSNLDGPLTFQRVVDRACEVVPGCDHCGLHLRKPKGKAESATATDEIAAEADRVQDELQDGPCVDSAFQEENFVISDLLTDVRWPQWAAQASALGIRSSMSIRLTVNDVTMGALNLYSDEPGSFDGDQDIAMIYASHAASAMASARLVDGLRTALDSRHSIGIAQGVLALRYNISYERAFQVLHRYSNDNNVKLRDVAEQVLETRSLPGTSGGSVGDGG